MALSRLTIDLAVDLAGFESDMGRAARVTERQLKSVEREIERFSVRAGALLGAALVTGLVQAGKAANEFGRSMAEVSTLLDDTSSLDSMTESVKTLAKEFGRAPTEQASALYQIISSGAEAGAEAIDVLTASNKLAVGGVTDLKTAADGLTSVMNAYGSEAGSVAEISDKFFAAMKAGKTTVGELSGAIGPVINIAKELGVSFDELIAAASTLTLSGNTTSQSFNALKAALANVVKPSKDAQQVAEQLGIDFNAAALESKGLAVFLAEVQKAAGGNTEAISKLFGSVEGLNAVLALTGSSADTFAEVLKSVQNAAGETDEAVSKMQETADQAFKRLSAAVKVELIEIGAVVLDKLVPAIELVTDNIDELGEALKVVGIAIATFTAVRLTAMTAGLIIAAKEVGALRLALTVLGGPLNVIGLAFAALATAAVKSAGPLREFLDGTTELRRATGDMQLAIQGVTDAWINQAEALELLNQREKLRQQVIAADIELMKVQERLARESMFGGRTVAEEAALGYKAAAGELANLQSAADAANQSIKEGTDAIVAINKRLDALKDGAKNAAAPMEDLAAAMDDVGDEVKRQDAALAGLVSELEKMEDASDRAADTVRGYIDELENADREQKNFERSLQSILDALNPIQAEGRRVGDMLADLTRALREGIISQAEYQRYVQQLTQDFNAFAAGAGVAAGGVDLLSVAIDEGARIIERTFQELFRDIISGSDDAWESIESGFQSMLASINSAATRGITVRIQEAFAEGGGGFSDLKLSGAFGQELVSSIGSILGLTSADTLFGQLGSTLGNIFGKTLFQKVGTSLFPKLLAGLGSWAGPIGTALGAIFGSVLGDLVGGVFERDLKFSLGGEDRRTRDDNQRIRSPLADILGLSGQGGAGDLRDPSTLLGQLGEALVAFDEQIANILKASVSDDQFNAVVDALEGWVGNWGEGVEAADVLASRFGAILSTFNADIQGFVRGAEDFEAQIERFGVALATEQILTENPDFLSGRTTAEVLAVVSAFQRAGRSMSEAFTEFLELAEQVIALKGLAKDFAGSDLLTDYSTIVEGQNRSLRDALDSVNSGLMDAIANYDGTVESLQEIGVLIATIREGEIRYLTELDALQKGLNASLDKLKADVLGISAPDLSGEQLFLEAQKLIGQIAGATSPEEIAGLQRQFDSLIRAISPEDQAFMESEIVALIELFRGQANAALDAERQRVLDNAAAMRDLVDVFQNRIGDALDIIAASNQQAADALALIANPEALPDTATSMPEAASPSGDVANQIIAANGIHSANQEEIMGEGLRQIDASVQQIGPIVAGALAQGLSQVSFTINLDGGGLVTQ